jgi:hypothetical protein
MQGSGPICMHLRSEVRQVVQRHFSHLQASIFERAQLHRPFCALHLSTNNPLTHPFLPRTTLTPRLAQRIVVVYFCCFGCAADRRHAANQLVRAPPIARFLSAFLSHFHSPTLSNHPSDTNTTETRTKPPRESIPRCTICSYPSPYYTQRQTPPHKTARPAMR